MYLENFLFKSNVFDFLRQLSSNFLDFEPTFQQLFKNFRATFWLITSIFETVLKLIWIKSRQCALKLRRLSVFHPYL